MVELDIARCRIERDIAAEWVKCRNAIIKELDKLGMTEAEWCQKALGCSIQTMRRRTHLLKGWNQYLKRRREVGDNGQYGLLYAASLASPASQAASVTDSFRNERSRTNNLHFASVGRQQPQPCCQLPAELVRRLLLVSCPDQGVAMDIFGGAGTTAMVALELGHKAISIDINPRYTQEARKRLGQEGSSKKDSPTAYDNQRHMLAAD